MNPFEHEYHVARLTAGGPTFRFGGRRYRLGTPSREARLEAAEVLLEAWREGALEGVPTRDELLARLVERGLWSGECEDRLGKLAARVDDLKARLYADRDRTTAARIHREELAAAKAEHARLLRDRHRLDHLSLETYARSASARFLAGASLLQGDGAPFWPDRDEGRTRADDGVVEAALRRSYEDRLGAAEVRELARSEAWRRVWDARTADESPFGTPAVDLDDEQRTLIGWSRLYEAAVQRPDGPPASVLEDDDMFDGWLVTERRKRDADDVESQFRKGVSDKVRGMDEVYVFADPDAEAGTLRSSPALINSLNDAEALQKKKERAAYVKSRGVVAEQDLPDVQLQFQAAALRGFAAHHQS